MSASEKGPQGSDRRSGRERRRWERRRQAIPVVHDRRSGHDRRDGADRRRPQT